MNIAIFTPNQNAYSETFIQAHKNYLKGNVFYYYGPRFDKQLEGSATLSSKWVNYFYKSNKFLFKKSSDFVKRKSLMHSLKKNKIEVVLVEYGTHAYDVLALIMETKIPMVVHFHGYDASVHQVLASCGNYRDVFNYAKKVVAVSRKMEEMLLDIGCPREKLVYNVYGPQFEFEAVKPTFEKKQFIGIGRFTNKKAPYYTILAFKEVVKKHPNAVLLLAGDGILFNSCKNLIRHYRLESNIKLLGVIEPEDYRTYLEESLAFVQHSVRAENGDMEGTPLAILEASSAGLPVISTFHAGIPDVIIHNETGFLCKEHDVETMADNMIRLIEDKELAKKMGAKGKTHIKAHFSLDKHIFNLQEIIESE